LSPKTGFSFRFNLEATFVCFLNEKPKNPVLKEDPRFEITYEHQKDLANHLGLEKSIVIGESFFFFLFLPCSLFIAEYGSHE
jgi:hypothetical protein